LTLLNPLTVAYFGALILGGGGAALQTTSGRILFVLGAGLASFSWQTLLAAIGALAGRHLSPRFQGMTSLVGNLIVVALGVRIIVRLLLPEI
jgi:arginine exporter protein ArgO